MSTYKVMKHDKMKLLKKICNFFRILLNFKLHYNYIKNINKKDNVMMQQIGGFDTGPGGSMVSGRWIHKTNGTVINVRDSLIDGDNMIIISDKGHIYMDEFSKNYIQVSDEVYNESGGVVSTERFDTNMFSLDKPAATTQSTQITHPIQTVVNNTNIQTSTVQVETVEVNKNYDLINKIFVKNNSKPNIKLDIDWADFPANELKMLVDFLDVPKEDISDYISKKFDMQQLFVESLCDFLKEKNL